MKHLALQVRRKPLLPLLLALLVVTLIGLLVSQRPVNAAPLQQEATETPADQDTATTPVAQTSLMEDHSGQNCGDCHLDFKTAWESGVHAIAFSKPSFQEEWQKADNDPSCLQCHTTEYQAATGKYLAEGIQCEACHGENPANHPPEPIVLQTDASICGDCHTGTFDEWRHSLHAFNEDMGAIGCATCHNPHSQTIRFDKIDDLCINCHNNNPDNPEPYAETYVHVTHNEVEFGSVNVTCASCHMYKNRIDHIHQLSNHTMKVSTVPCTDCHEQLAQTGQFGALVNVDSKLAEERDTLRTQVQQLESELSTATTEAEAAKGPNFVQLTQGLIIGLGVGITIIWVLTRRENGGSKQNNGKSKSE